jgi:hypothetical protein
LGHLKSALYARMEEVSFRSGAAVAGGVLIAAGVAITLAVALGGHSDAAASAPASRVAVPSVTPPSPAPATRHATTPAPGSTPTPRLRDPRSPAPPGPAARLVGQRAAAVALRPVTASPPPLTAARAGFVVLEAGGDPLAPARTRSCSSDYGIHVVSA